MKHVKRKILCTALVLAATTIPVIAASTLTATEAKDIASKYIPALSEYVNTEDDNNWFEVKFYHKDNKEAYEIDIDKQTKSIVSFDSDKLVQLGSNTITLTEEDAKKVLLNEIKDAEITSVTLKQDDGYSEYKVNFKTSTYYGEYSINPQTSEILERDINIGQIPDIKDLISYEKAIELVQVLVPNSIVTDIDLERENNINVYKIELKKDGMEYDYLLDAKTGNSIWNQSHKDDDWYNNSAAIGTSNNSSFIGLEKAQQIALDKAPGATVRKCEFDYEDGRAVYEGELYKNGWEYDFEIDAITGAILDWDAEFDD